MEGSNIAIGKSIWRRGERGVNQYPLQSFGNHDQPRYLRVGTVNTKLISLKASRADRQIGQHGEPMSFTRLAFYTGAGPRTAPTLGLGGARRSRPAHRRPLAWDGQPLGSSVGL